MGKRDAETLLAAFVSEIGDRPPATTPGRTLGELLERWYEACSPDWSPTTAYQTRWMIDHRLIGLRGRAVRDMTVQDLDTFYGALRARGGKGGRPLAPASVSRVHGVVRLALEQAVRWGWRKDNPAELANPGKHRTVRIKPPTPAEVASLLEAAGDMGSPPWRAFLDVTLPLSMPGIIAGSMLVFIPAIGEFVIPTLLGGPDNLMIGRVLWDEFFGNRDWPVASAVAIAFLVLLVGPIALYQHYSTMQLEA